MSIRLFVAACVLAGATACSQSPGGSVGSSELVTEAECRAMMEKGMELQGAPLDAVGELVAAATAQCVQKGTVTKDHYRCVMAATSDSESRACNVPV